MQTEYVVMRNFHMGEITQNLTAGERLAFDGTTMTRLKDGTTYQISSLSLPIRARLIIEDDGTQEFKPASQVRAEPKRPTLPVDIQNDDERIVATISLPDKVAGQNKRSTEEVAKTTGETAQRRIISEEQRVVGRAGRQASPGVAVVDTAEASAIAQAQEAEAEVVASTSSDRMKKAMDDALRAEGFGPQVTGGGMEIISDQSEGVEVAKIESLEDRKARLKQAAIEERKALAEARNSEPTEDEQAALADDIRLALAKRAGQAPTAASKVRTASVSEGEPDSDGLNEFGYPVGYPHNAHWRKRVEWCENNSTNPTRLRAVYAKSTESFQSRLVKTFPAVDFE